MNPTLAASLVALAGVLIGFVGRDITMALILAKQKRFEALQDRSREAARTRLGHVRSYADPLYEAARSLCFRLNEIVELRNPGYLLASAPRTVFIDYKRLSTSYRLAALLGWVRAFRRERSYLDPEDCSDDQETQTAIRKVEAALADGQHVESRRLDELLRLWRVKPDGVPDERTSTRLSTRIEEQRHRAFGDKQSRNPEELNKEAQSQLVNACAELVRQELSVEVPQQLVSATAEEAILYLRIREAYVYRDWQAAIGDFMIIPVDHGPRRFDIRGFGSFEDAYLAAVSEAPAGPQRRWFDRLDALFHDLDMSHDGIFDARREQVKNLQAGLKELETVLREKMGELSSPRAIDAHSPPAI